MKSILIGLATVVFFFNSAAAEEICGATLDRVAFYNIYQAAEVMASSGKVETAICLFEEAVKRDPQRGEARRARTYGMHFIDYRPLVRIAELSGK